MRWSRKVISHRFKGTFRTNNAPLKLPRQRRVWRQSIAVIKMKQKRPRSSWCLESLFYDSFLKYPPTVQAYSYEKLLHKALVVTINLKNYFCVLDKLLRFINLFSKSKTLKFARGKIYRGIEGITHIKNDKRCDKSILVGNKSKKHRTLLLIRKKT